VFRKERPAQTAPEGGRGAGNAGHLRRLNLERVLSVAIDRVSPFTRTELIEATGLSAPTVSSLVSPLIKSGLFRDLGRGPSRGGRWPSFMEFNARFGFVAGLDMGPTRTRLALADLRGQRLADRIVPTPSGVAPAAALGQIVADLRELMREAKIPADALLAVGAGAPGVVDREQGTVTFAPNLEGWSLVPMAGILKAELEAPVVVENDVNLAVLAEHWRGAARGHDTCVFLFVGTGIGAGILIDGRLHGGRHSMAGEIAVMCMGPQYVDVDFGKRGCLESLAGLQALAGRWPRGAHGDPATWMAELYRAASAGDREARTAIEETATLIGIAAANVGAVLDPSLIVLGGSLIANGEPFVEEVRRVVSRLARAPMQIAVSALGKEAPLWGSLLLAVTEARDRLRRGFRESKGAASAKPGKSGRWSRVASA
jgi:predicted NBD/HSP70 family sugar kinase